MISLHLYATVIHVIDDVAIARGGWLATMYRCKTQHVNMISLHLYATVIHLSR